jgi:hypothetical protein
MSAAIEPIWNRLRDVWIYPLRTSPLIVILIAATLTTAVSWVMFSALFQICIVAYVYKFGNEVLLHTAHGNLEPPEFASRVDDDSGWNQIKLLLAFTLLFFLAGMLPFPLSLVVWLILLAGYPAATIQVALENDWLGALNPLTWFTAMRLIGWSYIGVVLLTLAFFFSRSYLQEYTDFLPGVLSIFMASAIAFYFSIASFYMLGYLVYQHHQVLGFDSAPHSQSLPVVRAQQDPDQSILDEADALVQQGKLPDAVSMMGSHLKMRGGSKLFHTRYRKILQSTNDKARLLEHAQQWMSVLGGQNQWSDAMNLFVESQRMDPEFLPKDSDVWYEIARLLGPRSPDQALRLLLRFPAQFPKSKQMGKHCLLAARICAQEKLDNAGALRILETAITKFPTDADYSDMVSLADQLRARG